MTEAEHPRGAVLVLAGATAVAVAVGRWRPYAATAAGVLGVAAAVGVAYGPWLENVAERSRALGAAPDLVALLALSVRLDPALESATAFAAEHADGRLADSLAAHAREARGRPGAGFAAFAETWGDDLPSLRRAAALLDAAVDAPAGDRERLLDRTLAVAVEGARERASEYADAVHGPTTAVYAFGVVLPLALVGVAPAAASAGLPLTVGAVALAYDVALPLAVLAVVCWILARRPVAFPPAALPDDHPALAGRGRRALAAAACGVLAAVAATTALPGWALPLLAVGWPAGGALAAWCQPACAVRADVRDLEAGLADALSVLGQRIRHGRSVEAAVADVGDTVDGATGDAFAAAARRTTRLRVGVADAFCGDHGPLSRTPSQRARAAVSLVVHAADAGRPGGRVLVDVADLFDDLAALDREVRREFAATTRTLRHTGLVYAPLVAGVTVALSERVGGLDGATALPTPALALAVGGYVLWLAVVLPALAVGLDRGLDRSLVGYHAGVALLAATTVYPLTAVAAGNAL
ncbi:type II secretion system protein [Halobacterium yunchengense]|uniref:type II secretion system protein n=1 Tax=Halobacterium yunchengense TaxID=3108497 RepID=UPI0030096438